jgi:hypothetical protein
LKFSKFWTLIRSFVSEHIETLEEIDVEYKELALKSGIEKWGRVPALGCEPTFISDLADAVIESLPYVGAMAVSNIEARQVPLFSQQLRSKIRCLKFAVCRCQHETSQCQWNFLCTRLFCCTSACLCVSVMLSCLCACALLSVAPSLSSVYVFF